MKVRAKLMFSFAALAMVVLMVSGLALNSLTRSNARFTDYLGSVAEREDLVVEITGAANRRAVAARNLVLVTEASDQKDELAAVTRAHQDMKTHMAALKKVLGPDAKGREKDLLVELEKIEAAYEPVALGVVGLAQQGKREEAVAKMNKECRPLLAALLKTTHEFLQHEKNEADAAVSAAEAAYASDRTLLIVACLAAIGVAIGLGWVLSNAITRPLNRAVSLAEAVADGDLRTEIVVDSSDETGALLASLKKMNANLVAMIGQVRTTADGIVSASGEIATGTLDLSSRTEQQASALQQTAASMQEMTQTVQRNAGSSRQAGELAHSAAEVAGRGRHVVDRVVTTMGDITDSSKKISDIIGVIDGIAFQTNILALNAAVEAARAGESGRGFAVVASEVRSLAQRSAQAAREIKALIQESVGKVEAGGQLVEEAGKTMSEIVSRVQRMTDLTAEISASTDAQSEGIAQVNQAVASLDQGTQQNAALVEESSAASMSMRQQAEGLQRLVAAFKTA
jgi:methyl-accepting chemotaxis protein-1 (serine sensor receptor)